MNLEKITVRQIWRQLTWKQLVSIFGVIVPIVGGLIGIGYYYAGLEYKVVIAERDWKIQDYSARWAAIEPHLNMDRFFDIGERVISVP